MKTQEALQDEEKASNQIRFVALTESSWSVLLFKNRVYGLGTAGINYDSTLPVFEARS
jgi:hypothetical protein